MGRIKINIPSTFQFSVHIPVRITDLNYGGHVGNDKILTLIHEARVLFLNHYGYSELNMEGTGLIMSDASIEYKTELFASDHLTIHVTLCDFSRVGFDFYYKLIKNENQLVAIAKTGMVCYDYQARKLITVPEKILQTFNKN